MDSDNGLAMNLGETYLVTENGNERLGETKVGFNRTLGLYLPICYLVYS